MADEKITYSNMQKWDTIESDVSNVYFLRKCNFEAYFQSTSHDQIALIRGDRIRGLPDHWPKAWVSKEILWNSVGTLWAKSHQACSNYIHSTGDIDNDYQSNEMMETPNIAYFENEMQRDMIDEDIHRVRNELSWDYLIVYFDQNEGVFDGVCTVSIRIPNKKSTAATKPCAFAPYFAIGSLATEQSLTEEGNEKVTKSLVDAVRNLRDKIAQDLLDHNEGSIWYKKEEFIPSIDPLLISIAFQSQTQSYFRLRNSNHTLMNDNVGTNDKKSEEEACEKDFITFWEDKIGFQEATRDDTVRVLRKYKTPFEVRGKETDVENISSEDDEEVVENNKKRKKDDECSISSENSTCSIITQTIIDEYDNDDDSAIATKMDAIMEDFQSKIKLWVMRG